MLSRSWAEAAPRVYGMHAAVKAVWAAAALEPPKDLELEDKSFDLLAKRNKHPLDDYILFEERRHKYAVGAPPRMWTPAIPADQDESKDSYPAEEPRAGPLAEGTRWLSGDDRLTSVTKVIEPFSSGFDKLSISNACANKQLRLKKELEQSLRSTRPYIKYRDCDEVFAVPAPETDWPAEPSERFAQATAVLSTLPAQQQAGILQRAFGDEIGCYTGEAVCALWDANSKFGTDLHLDVEKHINGVAVERENCAAWAQYLAFRKDHPDMEFYRVEWRIFDPYRLITGTIDAVVVLARHPDGRPSKVRLIDWKTSKAIYKDKAQGFFAPPLAHIRVNDVNKYTVQLNLYASILEEFYDLEVVDMYLLVFHKNYAGYQKIRVDMLREATQDLLQAHLDRLVDKIEGREVPKYVPKVRAPRKRPAA